MGYLGINRPTAVGLLELLWHYTAQFAPAGDIGRFSDHVIAEGVSWEGNPTELVDALVASGWLDRCDCHRLRVHDWHEHADQVTKRYLSKHNQVFAACYTNASTELALCQSETSNAYAYAYAKDERDHERALNNKSKLTPQDDETRRQDTRAQRSKTKRSCAEAMPLSSTGAEKVHQLITKLWPEYKDPSARETAARLHVGYGEKMNLLAEIEKARIAWPPERSVHAGNGLHGYLAAWMNNVQNAARDDEKGSQGPSIAKSLATLERDIKRGALLDPQKFTHTVNTAVEAGENLPLEIHLLIEAAVAAGNMERRRTGKIDPLWPTPERPSKIREPPGRQLTQEEVRKMVAKIGKKK